MRNVNKTIISATDATSQTSPSIDTNQIIAVSFHASFSDASVAGSVKVQVSNDINVNNYMGTFIPTNWVDLPSATGTVTAGSPVVISVPQACYQSMRVVFTQTTPGIGVVTVNMNGLSL